MTEPQLFPNPPKVEEHVKKNSTAESSSVALAPKLNDISTRLKILEERYVALRKKSQLTEQNIIESEKDSFEEIHLLNDNLLDVKRNLKNLTEKLSLLSDEISSFASRNDFKVLERYVNFWNPIDFVTRKEVNDFLRKKFLEKKNKN